MKYKLLMICALVLGMLAACRSDYENYRVFVQDKTVTRDPATITPESSVSIPQVSEPTDDKASLHAHAPNWSRIYTAFLSESYHQIMDICEEGIAGIGFIDLDIDYVPELVIFDYGTTTMGVQLFDIVDGNVVCITTSASELGDFFDNTYLQDIRVATGLFEDFRLMVNSESGMRIFVVESATVPTVESAIEPSDSEPAELIIFSSSGEALYLLEAEACGISYEFLFEAFDDAQYDAAGTFIWEKLGYNDGFTGFMAMVENSLKLYNPLPEP